MHVFDSPDLRFCRIATYKCLRYLRVMYREHCTGKYLFRISDGLSTILIMVSGHIPRLHLTDECKSTAFPVQAWKGPWASKKFRLSEFVENQHMKLPRLSAVRTGHLYPPGNIPGTHFCWRMSRFQGHNTAGRIMSMVNPTDPIGNRTRDLPACSLLPLPTEPQRSPSP